MNYCLIKTKIKLKNTFKIEKKKDFLKYYSSLLLEFMTHLPLFFSHIAILFYYNKVAFLMLVFILLIFVNEFSKFTHLILHLV